MNFTNQQTVCLLCSATPSFLRNSTTFEATSPSPSASQSDNQSECEDAERGSAPERILVRHFVELETETIKVAREKKENALQMIALAEEALKFSERDLQLSMRKIKVINKIEVSRSFILMLQNG